MVVTTEDKLKVKLRICVVSIIVLIISLCVFVKLYVDEGASIVIKYRQQYMNSVSKACDVIDNLKKDSFDGERKYREVTANLATAETLLFLTDDSQKNKVTMTELYHAFVKYPDQMSAKINNVSVSLEKIKTGKTQEGYDEISKIVSSIDKFGS